jgi:hypothetical protein
MAAKKSAIKVRSKASARPAQKRDPLASPPAAMDDGQGAVAAGFTVIGIGREGFLTDFLQRVTRMPAAEPVVQIRVGEPA